jgi:DNA polymerase-3 subunit delta'
MDSAFAPLVGQEQAIALLTAVIERQRVPPAYLFAGPDGVGRALAARCFIEALFCTEQPQQAGVIRQKLAQGNHPDLLWVEPSYLVNGVAVPASAARRQGQARKTPPQIRLEQVRDIGRFLARPSLEAGRAVVVLEQAETMAEAAANGLLKTLEEPGAATLILLAPGPEALLPTLVSRCQRIPFQRLAPEAMDAVLERSGYGEIRQQPAVLSLAQGCPGAAIAHWNRLQSLDAQQMQSLLTLPTTLVEALTLAKEIDKALELEDQVWLLDYWQQQLWQSGRAGADDLRRMEETRRQLLGFVQPRLVWETTLIGFLER